MERVVIQGEIVSVESVSSGSVGSMTFMLLLAFRYFSSEITRERWPRAV